VWQGRVGDHSPYADCMYAHVLMFGKGGHLLKRLVACLTVPFYSATVMAVFMIWPSRT
jgi:hypothetical protein